MSLKVGIIGLPNVGKSTLFNALLRKRVALSANYPFATVEPNRGIVPVSDERLQKIAEVVKEEEKMQEPPPIMPAVVEFVDIAGLVKGAHQGEGLGNQFLSHIREVDALVHVLRDFHDDQVVQVGAEDPVSDRAVVETELALADLPVVDKLIEHAKDQGKLVPILEDIKLKLEQGRSVNEYQVEDKKLSNWVKQLPLLCIKPVLYVHNVDEQGYAGKLRNTSPAGDHTTVVISARLEEELADLTDEERTAYLAELGIGETGLERLIKKAYQMLSLISFFTAGRKEIRAWSILFGTSAAAASGVIHSDFEQHFIKAEVVAFADFLASGGWKGAKALGKISFQGRDYMMQDGDVVLFRVNA